jgi:hypothetical protein
LPQMFPHFHAPQCCRNTHCKRGCCREGPWHDCFKSACPCIACCFEPGGSCDFCTTYCPVFKCCCR